jgi:hypothetical protein
MFLMHKCEDLHKDSVGGGARRLQEFKEHECKTLDTIWQVWVWGYGLGFKEQNSVWEGDVCLTEPAKQESMAEEDGKAKRWAVTHVPGKEETGDSTGKIK